MKIKTDVNWFLYDIDWVSMAKSSCKKCYGRGHTGFVKKDDGIDALMCDCIVKKWSKMTDEERLKRAKKKENADEMLEKAKEVIEKAAEEIKAEQKLDKN